MLVRTCAVHLAFSCSLLLIARSQHQQDTSVSAKRYFQGRQAHFSAGAYSNCSLRYAMDTVHFFSRNPRIQWMPLVYEELLKSPASAIADVLLFYEVTHDRQAALLAADRAVQELKEDREHSLRLVYNTGTHRHQDEDRQDERSMRMLQRAYAHLVREARACSNMRRPVYQKHLERP
jgi:hypothetical protein